MLGGYHGEPFRGAGWDATAWWGGYCNHGNVLFPTWHRAYLLQARRGAAEHPGCDDVDAALLGRNAATRRAQAGIPWRADRREVRARRRADRQPAALLRPAGGDTVDISPSHRTTPNYSKPQGYETVRYPLSGLVGNPDDQAATKAHNAKYPDYDENVKLLNAEHHGLARPSAIVVGRQDSARPSERQFTRPASTRRTTPCSPTPPRRPQWNTTTRRPPVAALEKPAQRHPSRGRRLRRARPRRLLADRRRQRRHGRERHRRARPDLLCRLLTRSSTTAGSASVEVSPRLAKSSSAILRRMRRMILPERVLGRPGENWIRSGEAIGPISLRTCATSSLRSSSLGSLPCDQRDVAVDALALDVVRIADDGGLRHLGMRRPAPTPPPPCRGGGPRR